MSNSAGNFNQFPGPLGPKCDAPINAFYNDRDPTIYDINASILDQWINTESKVIFQLAANAIDPTLQIQVATWVPIGLGAGEIIQVTTDDANVVVPSSGNINIFGQPGFLTTNGATPNTIYINFIGNGPALRFQANAGGFAIPVAGTLNVFGGSNISTTAAGNQITVNLNDSINISGGLTSSTVDTGTLSVSGSGSINGLLLVGGSVSTVGGFEALAGNLQIDSLGEGVALVDDTGLFSSSHGTDGQILISRTTGSPAVDWANILSPSSVIAITNGPNTISLAMGGQGAFEDLQVFYWDHTTGQFATVPAGADGEVLTYQDGLPPAWMPGGGGGGGTVSFLEGNSGGLVGPTVGGVISVVGDGTITDFVGNPGTNTLTGQLLSTTTAGQILRSSGTVATTPAYSTATYPATTAVGDVLISPTLNTISGLTFDGTASRYLANTGSGGTLPAWDTIDLTDGVSGVLDIPFGGTNQNSFSSTNGTVYFDGTSLETVAPGTSGWILTSQGASLPPVYAPNSGGGGGGGVTTFNTDIGGPALISGVSISILGDATNIDTDGNTGSTVKVILRDTIHWPVTNTGGTAGVIYLGNSRFIHNYGSTGLASLNTFAGSIAGNFTLTGTFNTGCGQSTLNALTSGSQNSAFGVQALNLNQSGGSNTALGYLALTSLVTGDRNTIIGSQAADSLNGASDCTIIGRAAGSGLVSGGNNIFIGSDGGINITTTSNNIIVGHNGVLGDSGVLRIGTTAVITSAFITGINGASVGTISTPTPLVGINATDQLGSFTLTSTGASVAITYPTTNTINLEAVGSGAVTGITGNSGGIVHPLTGNFDIFGGTNIATVASSPGSQGTITINLSGTPTIAGPVTISNLGLGVVQASATGVLTSSDGSNGQVLIASTTGGTAPVWANITAGTGIAVTNGSGTISIALSGTIVNSITGTANQVTASASTGTVTLSTPSIFIGPGSVAATTTVGAGTNLLIPATSSTIGQIIQNGIPVFHTLGASSVSLGAFAGNVTGITGDNNTSLGWECGLALTSANNNVLIGKSCATATATILGSVVIGSEAVGAATAQANNSVIIGYQAANALTTGSINNILIGYQAVLTATSGTARNVVLGLQSGSAWTTNSTDNIYIGNVIAGAASESNTLRIGNATGTGNNQVNRAFMAGITGITVTGAAVLVSSTGQLGVAVSSRKYKENISSLINSDILKLNPVIFTYKSNPEMGKQYGLIAEEVHEVMPDLVVYKDGEPDTVQYHILPTLLLQALQAQDRRIKDLNFQIESLWEAIGRLDKASS